MIAAILVMTGLLAVWIGVTGRGNRMWQSITGGGNLNLPNPSKPIQGPY